MIELSNEFVLMLALGLVLTDHGLIGFAIIETIIKTGFTLNRTIMVKFSFDAYGVGKTLQDHGLVAVLVKMIEL